MIKAVQDTNVIISSIFWRGNPYEVIKKGVTKKFQIIISPDIIEEVIRKLKIKFDFPDYYVQIYIRLLLSFCKVITPISEFDVVRDKTDNKIIDCAFDGKADYIVTGDPDLLELKEFRRIKIVTPKEFLEIVGK